MSGDRGGDGRWLTSGIDPTLPLDAAKSLIDHVDQSLPFACREMMAMGKPMIVSDTGGLPENLTPGEGGWLVPPGGHGYIAQLLMLLLCNPSEVERAGTAARAKSEAEFSLQTFAARTEAVYVECLSRVSPLAAEKDLVQRMARGRTASSAS
jgi:hypothetical protein